MYITCADRTFASQFMIRIIYSILLLICSNLLLAQTPEATVHYIEDEIQLDGKLDEDFWQKIPKNSPYQQYFPTDTVLAQNKTEIYFGSTDKAFIIAVRCETTGNDYIIPTLRRDFRAGGNDNITFLIDTYSDGTNAFMFGINPLGVIREGLISGGGNGLNGFSTAWDNKWKGESYIGDNYWSAELVIPFSTLRFNDGSDTWRMSSYRFDMQGNERSTWVPIPRNQFIFNLAFSGILHFEKAPVKQGKNISIIPYLTGTLAQKDLSVSNTVSTKANIGVDAKIALTSGLNLDLSINPDFSQVEVDAQITDLSRFELFFPEQRQFFLENADLFGSFGTQRINPFFSRRIGVGVDTSTDLTVQNAMIYGARLSGKLNDDLRVGILNAQTAQNESRGISSTNFSVATVQHKILKRSNLTGIFVNKTVTGKLLDDEANKANSVAGLQFNFQNEKNNWVGTAYAMKSFTEGITENDFVHSLRIAYNSLRFSAQIEQNRVAENFNAEVGFVPRKDLQRLSSNLSTSWYPSGSKINRIQLSADGSVFFRLGDNKLTDNRLRLRLSTDLINTSRASIELISEYVFLRGSFSPIGDEFKELAEGEEFNFRYIRASYNSNRRKILSFRLTPTIGQFYNGNRYGFNGNFQLRLQPKVGIGLNYNINHIALADDFGEKTLFLIGPRLDLTFSKSLFITGFFQYNNQIDNFNVNARLQWRFAPVSDLFIVYTDNYDTSTNWSGVNRNLTVKINYWLNL